ncbi:beta-ketoacyl synthase N-terminal-like domain-containing protein [Fictibacillus phosphorivorans]|uniref:type I polyketide synthase n=1 Tax=Fictibacillus phosphorivorans TaxID=1221500 RepID=UPI003CEFC74C
MAERDEILQKIYDNQITAEEGMNLIRSLKKNGSVVKGKKQPARNDVAVIGISGQFPEASHIEEFWENLQQGKDSVKEITRWDPALYYSQDRTAINKSYSNHGGFLTDIDKFDPLFFNISPKQAELMEPRQRLFLKEAWRAIEHAGYSHEALEGKKCGIFVGCEGGTDYFDGQESDTKVSSEYFLGASNSILASRISYFMDLKGPSLTVDTACSSSMVAIHLACESLRNGTSDIAISGSVTLMSLPGYILLSSMGMLSPDGKSKTFDNHANGFVPGEAVAVVVLKLLDKAIEDGDRIYGVIKGSGVNQDGKTNGITAPSATSQARLEKEVYQNFGIDPETISYVEAHGTGTELGDPIELEGLKSAFSSFTDKKQFCAIGSVKTNIGHTGATSGISGLVKVIMSLKNKKIPPSLHYQEPNKRFNFKESPFYVNTELKTWNIEKGKKRRAAISSFGHSGTNCHLVIEEAPEPSLEKKEPLYPHYLIVLSSRRESELKRKVEDLLDWLMKEGGNYPLLNISHTLQSGRSHFKNRIALVIKNKEDLINQLRKILSEELTSSTLLSTFNMEKAETVHREIVSVIDNDEKEKNNSLNYEGFLYSVALNYLKQIKIDWKNLYRLTEGQPVKVPLPTYPFSEKSYYLKSKDKQLVVENSPFINVLSPVLDLNISTLEEQCFKKTLKKEEFFIRDHIVQDKLTLPGAVCLEMARNAGDLSSTKHKVAKIKNVFWAQPITIDDQHKDVFVRIKSIKKELNTMSFLIFSVDKISGKEVTHSQGQLVYEDIGTKSVIEQVEVNPINKKWTQSITKEECYRQYKKMGLNYGESFQTIHKIYGTTDETIGELKISEELKQSFHKFKLHPSILDGAFQTIIGIVQGTEANKKGLYIPYSIGEIEIIEPLNEMCYALVKETVIKQEAKMYNITLLSNEGKTLVRIKEFSARKIKEEASTSDSALLEVLNRLKDGNIDEKRAMQLMGEGKK